MNDSDPEFPRWQEIYQRAILETDTVQLKRRVLDAEDAIQLRLTELQGGEDAIEKAALARAAAALRVLRRTHWG
jgi:hypothetical protein